DVGGGNGGGRVVGRSGDVRRSAAGPLKLVERHPPLPLSLFPGPFPGCFPRRFSERLLDQFAGFARGRFVYGRAGPPECLFNLAPRFEQVRTGLLPRLALERLGARFHLALPLRDLVRARIDPRRIFAQRRVACGQLLLPRLELPRALPPRRAARRARARPRARRALPRRAPRERSPGGARWRGRTSGRGRPSAVDTSGSASRPRTGATR